MQPTKQSVHQIFDISRRLVVPLYQRAYVWDLEKHWEPFFGDIRSQACNCIYGSDVPGHFLGPIVTQAEMVSAGGHPRYNIIDGQQRLTSLQIFLKALHLIAADMKHWAAGEFERLIRNPARTHIGPEEVYKVWPTNADQKAFQRNMDIKSAEQISANPNTPTATKLDQAFSYFYSALQAFVNGQEGDQTDPRLLAVSAEKRLEALQQALTSRLYFIVLELESADDPQVIFETLNARGEPLLPSDLIRNDLFLRALREKLDADALYRKFWSEFEEKKLANNENSEDRFWHVMETQGRLYRPRIDLFVFHWLSMKRTISQQHDELLIGNLYREFKKWTERQKLSAQEIFEDLAQSRANYERLLSGDTNGRISVTAARLRAIDTGTAHPLLLFLIGKYCLDISNPEFERVLTILESYLVRRLLTNGTTKNYNRTFLNLLAKVSSADEITSIAELVETELSSLKGSTVEWPDDDLLKKGILDNPIYVKSRPGRVRMVLAAIENRIRALSGSKTEELLANDDLSIEHFLPQEFSLEEYPYANDFDFQNEPKEIARDRLLDTLGNLTLLTQPLNSAVSNGPFLKKRHEIVEHSVLRLNKFLSGSAAPTIWNETNIHSRALELFAHVKEIWPGPVKTTAVEKAARAVTSNKIIEEKRASIMSALSGREGQAFLNVSGALFRTNDDGIRAVCTLSKRYDETRRPPYWYGYSPQWKEYLSKGNKSYFVLGCMDRAVAYAIPTVELEKVLSSLYRTPDRHWHIDLQENGSNVLELAIPDGSKFDLERFSFRL